MIVEKVFTCSVENVDEIVLGLAKELEAGWHIASIEHLPFEISRYEKPEPCCKIHLVRLTKR